MIYFQRQLILWSAPEIEASLGGNENTNCHYKLIFMCTYIPASWLEVVGNASFINQICPPPTNALCSSNKP
jgi:cellobiose phosphorylase